MTTTRKQWLIDRDPFGWRALRFTFKDDSQEGDMIYHAGPFRFRWQAKRFIHKNPSIEWGTKQGNQ